MSTPARTAHRRPIPGLLAGLVLMALLAAVPTTAAAADPGTTTVTLLATNDFHRQLAPEDGHGGAAYLAAHLQAAGADDPGTLVVDVGDMTGSGTNGYGLPGGVADEATVDVMNAIGLDVTAAGNHEFDGGLAELYRLRDGGCYADDCGYRGDQPHAGAGFETLAANVHHADTGESVYPAWTIREVSGVRVGLVGATNVTTIERRDFDDVTTSEVFDAVTAASDDAMAAGADFVVVLLHDGSRQTGTPATPNTCAAPSGNSTWYLPWLPDSVAAVVDGHTHSPYVCDLPDMPLMTQAVGHGFGYTEITLEWDAVDGVVVDRHAENRMVTHDVAPRADVQALVDGYRDRMAVPAPPEADLDGDLLGDTWEVVVAGTDPRSADTDGDGIDDATEIGAGSDPLDPADPGAADEPVAEEPVVEEPSEPESTHPGKGHGRGRGGGPRR